jgi:glycerophosphoryl diester phosphodiesterase
VTLVEIIAHRGAGARFVDPDGPPENTLPAFEAGWASGASACEVDVQLTRDNEVIAIHDPTTDRTTNGSWFVAERTSRDLKLLDAGAWKGERWAGTRLPLLSEVLAAIPAGRKLYVELKDGPQVVPPALEAIRKSGKDAQIILISFDIDTIALAKKLSPRFECQLVVTFRDDGENGAWNVHYNEGPNFRGISQLWDPRALLKLVREHRLDGIDASFRMPPDFVPSMRDARLEVVTWTVNDPSVALSLIERGVFEITTDLPAMMRRALLDAGVSLA